MRVVIEMSKSVFNTYVSEALGSDARHITSELELHITENNAGENIMIVPILSVEPNNRK